MQITAPRFKQNADKALNDAQLQRALTNVQRGFIDKRRKAVDALPEFEALRDAARDIKTHSLDHLDLYLETYEKNVTAAGGHVHWAETADDARRTIL
ncbi:MAG TPA: (Fe-S)-binding protein, partial [Afifellaceae bacterium]|nr:(Fe-S)-binding protein [Afifellaceae bacterium]